MTKNPNKGGGGPALIQRLWVPRSFHPLESSDSKKNSHHIISLRFGALASPTKLLTAFHDIRLIAQRMQIFTERVSWTIDHLHNYRPGTRFEALPAGTDCGVCVSHLSFCFLLLWNFFWQYTIPPFLKYSFRRVMLQLDHEFRESKCKREGSHLEQSWRHTGGVHIVCMRGGDLIYRHLPFKKLGFFEVQLWPLFFSQVLFQTSNGPT